MRKPSNVASIVLSWLMAIGFLGLLSLWSQPPAKPSQPPAQVNLPDQILHAPYTDITVLKASVWCALGSGQEAVLKTASRELRMRGAMALAPHWRGEALKDNEQAQLDNCVALRLEQLNRDQPHANHALSFLFSGR